MKLEIDYQQYVVERTIVIPPAYAHVALPAHQPEVVKGDFGVLISQWVHKQQFSLCVNYFHFFQPAALLMKPAGPCSSFYFAIQGNVIIQNRQRPTSKVIQIQEGNIARLEFRKASGVNTVEFEGKVYISVHVTIPHVYKHVISDERWIMGLLQEYGRMVQKSGGKQV
jgi:hypothetical protein